MLLQHDDDAVLAEARATTNRVARTFAIACRMLPRHVRDDVYRLYLVFRTLDDVVDEGRPDAEARVAAVESWARGGRPLTPEARLLDSLAARYPIPAMALADFCSGMRTDIERAGIETEDALDLYCYRVAGTVGLTMAAVLGTRAPGAQRPAAALGMAMQRTNILRDIDEDLAGGRVYLARETLIRFGWTGPPPPGFREALLRDQIARAEALYEEGCAGIPLLASGRRAIAAAAAMYREILRQIERDGYGAHAGRAVVRPRRKLVVAARAAAA